MCFHRMMGADEFGRIELPLAFTTTNAFKLDSLHGLAATRQHHPTNWSREAFLQMFQAADMW